MNQTRNAAGVMLVRFLMQSLTELSCYLRCSQNCLDRSPLQQSGLQLLILPRDPSLTTAGAQSQISPQDPSLTKAGAELQISPQDPSLTKAGAELQILP